MGPNRQHDLFEADAAAMPPSADPARMRRLATERLDSMLAELRGAVRMPWDAPRERVNRIIFPQMINWLPPGEAAARLADFHAELDRLRNG